MPNCFSLTKKFQSYSDAGENLTEDHKVLDYLEANYTPDAWAEIGGRR